MGIIAVVAAVAVDADPPLPHVAIGDEALCAIVAGETWQWQCCIIFDSCRNDFDGKALALNLLYMMLILGSSFNIPPVLDILNILVVDEALGTELLLLC